MEIILLEITALFFCIENCSFVWNHYSKLHQMWINIFCCSISTIFHDKINDFYFIYDNFIRKIMQKYYLSTSKSCADIGKHWIIKVL